MYASCFAEFVQVGRRGSFRPWLGLINLRRINSEMKVARIRRHQTNVCIWAAISWFHCGLFNFRYRCKKKLFRRRPLNLSNWEISNIGHRLPFKLFRFGRDCSFWAMQNKRNITPNLIICDHWLQKCFLNTFWLSCKWNIRLVIYGKGRSYFLFLKHDVGICCEFKWLLGLFCFEGTSRFVNFIFHFNNKIKAKSTTYFKPN